MSGSRGFTLIEIMLVIVIISAMVVVAVPRVAETMTREAVRGARMTMTTQLARARGAAANRGCEGVVHLDASRAQVWVTACRLGATGIDTVGAFEQLGRKYGVAMSTTADSIIFTPNGLAVGNAWVSMKFSRGNYTDTLTVSPVGRAVW